MARTRLCGPAMVALVAGAACNGAQAPPPQCPKCPGAEEPSNAEPQPPTVAEARAFMDRVDEELEAHLIRRERAAWVQNNFITVDTEAIASEADQETMQYLARVIPESTRFDDLELPPELRRQLHLLKLAGTLPAPPEEDKAAELARITTQMQSRYGKGKYCPKQGGALRRELAKILESDDALDCEPGEGGVSLTALSKVMAQSRDEAALKEAWVGWRKVSPPMREQYARYVELGNEGARAIGFSDVGQMWRSGYDMPPEDFRAEVERMYEQVRPFYEKLHCYVRAKLRERYGEDVVPKDAPIPAHLLGNMWSQTWGNVYELVEPHPGQASIDVTAALERQGYTPVKMVKLAEGFFTSLGLDPLPETFWERSLFEKPEDREVVCHASAWDVTYDDDLRIKMCIQVTGEELGVVHHELGHNYYFHYYHDLPILFQDGANDGFHEAIGDAIALSITPGYLHEVGVLPRVVENDRADLNYLMKMALDKAAFLPFGKLIDQWRWDVFAGEVSPKAYNDAWWELRTRYQGIAPPVERSEAHFDPGAKYHVPANVPYIRYFLAFIYQFQFQRALCEAAGHEGPLHECSIYGNEKAGDKLRALLSMGASKPWQDALEAMTGERKGDATAMLEYFAPLRTWLDAELEGKSCGW